MLFYNNANGNEMTFLPGKIIWLTGAPGMGKSTSAQILARNHGYVYYEADCFAILKNPYIPLDVSNPSLAQVHQATLKGPGMEERKVVIERFRNLGFSYDGAVMMDYYQHLAADIVREKARVGGDWTVAAVLLKRENRDQLRWVISGLSPATSSPVSAIGSCWEVTW